jgi:hypothetical protein
MGYLLCSFWVLFCCAVTVSAQRRPNIEFAMSLTGSCDVNATRTCNVRGVSQVVSTRVGTDSVNFYVDPLADSYAFLVFPLLNATVAHRGHITFVGKQNNSVALISGIAPLVMPGAQSDMVIESDSYQVEIQEMTGHVLLTTHYSKSTGEATTFAHGLIYAIDDRRSIRLLA